MWCTYITMSIFLINVWRKLLCPTWDHCDQNLAAKIIHSHFCIWINSNVFVHLLSFGLPVLEESCLLGSGLVPRLSFGSTLRTYKMAMRGASSACHRDMKSNINSQVNQAPRLSISNVIWILSSDTICKLTQPIIFKYCSLSQVEAQNPWGATWRASTRGSGRTWGRRRLQRRRTMKRSSSLAKPPWKQYRSSPPRWTLLDLFNRSLIGSCWSWSAATSSRSHSLTAQNSILLWSSSTRSST